MYIYLNWDTGEKYSGTLEYLDNNAPHDFYNTCFFSSQARGLEVGGETRIYSHLGAGKYEPIGLIKRIE